MLTQSEISKLPCLYVVKAYIIHSGMFLNLVQIFKLVRNICLAFEVKFQYMKSIVEYKMSWVTDEEGITVLWNIGDYLPFNTV